MSKLRDAIFDKVAVPLIVLALTPAATLVGSKLQSGDWLTWLEATASWAYTVFFSLVGLWIVGAAILRRIRTLRERNLPSLPIAFSIPQWGYTTVGTLKYKDVLWRVRIPSPAPWEPLTESEARKERVDIETPPRCPNCDTELEETETFFGKHKWTCVRCGFMRRNEMSFYREALRAEKLAQSNWEKGPEHTHR